MPNLVELTPRNGNASAAVAEPLIVGFFCTWCTYLAADLAGTSRIKYSPNVRVVRVMCSGRIDPQFVLNAFARGADGVLIGGCHPGDCHYQEGNYNCLRRSRLLRRVLLDLGIEEERFRVEWISAAEGDRVRVVIDDMVGKLRKLGPLRMKRDGLPERIAAPELESPLPAGVAVEEVTV
jgi:F420-non-reducing hydrogenase iron-sulfur subunit